MQLTQKELNWLADQLDHEQLMITKFNSYANSSTDPQTRTLYQDIAQRHQNHFNTLMNYLKSS